MADYPIEFTSKEDEVAFKRQVEEWDKEYGTIYTVDIKDHIFVFRGVTYAEMKRATKLYEDEKEREEYICRMCVLEPVIDDYSLEIFAGVPSILANHILVESGYSDDASKINMLMHEKEQEMENVMNQIPCVIKEAFQDLSLEEIENWPMEKTIEYYVRAKWLLQNLRGMELVSQDEAEKLAKPPMQG